MWGVAVGSRIADNRRMEPQIRYVKTSDGVSIAYAAAGEGPPRVMFEDRGEHALKGIAEPQRVFAVRKDAG